MSNQFSSSPFSLPGSKVRIIFPLLPFFYLFFFLYFVQRRASTNLFCFSWTLKTEADWSINSNSRTLKLQSTPVYLIGSGRGGRKIRGREGRIAFLDKNSDLIYSRCEEDIRKDEEGVEPNHQKAESQDMNLVTLDDQTPREETLEMDADPETEKIPDHYLLQELASPSDHNGVDHINGVFDNGRDANSHSVPENNGVDNRVSGIDGKIYYRCQSGLIEDPERSKSHEMMELILLIT